MIHQKPMMKPTRKEYLRREMVACVKEARAELKYGGDEFAAKYWQDEAAKRLFQLGGMAAQW